MGINSVFVITRFYPSQSSNHYILILKWNYFQPHLSYYKMGNFIIQCVIHMRILNLRLLNCHQREELIYCQGYIETQVQSYNASFQTLISSCKFTAIKPHRIVIACEYYSKHLTNVSSWPPPLQCSYTLLKLHQESGIVQICR